VRACAASTHASQLSPAAEAVLSQMGVRAEVSAVLPLFLF
jgi:hypothetical protein